MTRVVYWSEFNLWLQCPTWHDFQYVKKQRVYQETPQMAEGKLVGAHLATRLRTLDTWKPPRVEGLSNMLREYHSLYEKDDLSLAPWRAEAAFTRELMSGIELGCIADAVGVGAGRVYVRETKVTDDPNTTNYLEQLEWNMWCAGAKGGELDIILRPGFKRSDWAFERRGYALTPEKEARLVDDVALFLGITRDALPWRNSKSCKWCPHVESCWGQL